MLLNGSGKISPFSGFILQIFYSSAKIPCQFFCNGFQAFLFLSSQTGFFPEFVILRCQYFCCFGFRLNFGDITVCTFLQIIQAFIEFVSITFCLHCCCRINAKCRCQSYYGRDNNTHRISFHNTIQSRLCCCRSLCGGFFCFLCNL